MAEIKIDSGLFQERVSHFVGAWKNDLRSKEGPFNGASSIVILMGKPEDGQDFHKNNAMHVSLWGRRDPGPSTRPARKLTTMVQFWLLGYEFPATLMLFTLDCLYVVTTAKKGRFTWQGEAA